MIIGVGTDLTNIQRIENAYKRYGHRFLSRCFTAAEIAKAQSRARKEPIARTLAKCFAAKEACVKAMGIGFRDGIYLKDIEVLNDQWGKPMINLYDKAHDHFMGLKATNIHVSLSDEPPMALAYVIIEKTIIDVDSCSKIT